MAFDSENSLMTSFNIPDEGYNSLLFIYKGRYENALVQADIIARNMNVPMAKEYSQTLELKQKYGNDILDIKGVAYMNYEFSGSDVPYRISIRVDESGILSINISDMTQRNAVFSTDTSSAF